MGKITDWLSKAIGVIGKGWEIEVVKIAIVLAIYFSLLILTLALFSALLRRHKKNLEPSSYTTLKMVGRMFIVSMYAAAFLNQFSQFQGTLLGFSALVGTAIGFASTQTIGNFVAGIYVIITRPFSVGDYVILPSMEIEGVVEEITINYTSILLPNQTKAMVSNRSIIDARIINTRREKEKIRAERELNLALDNQSKSEIKNKRRDWTEESKELFKSIFDNDKIVKYDYPLRFGIDTSVSFSRVERILSDVIPAFQQEFMVDIVWGISKISRLETEYFAVISVPEAKDLLFLPSRLLFMIRRQLDLKNAT